MHIVIFDKGLKSPRKMSLLSISLSLIICLLLVSSLGLVIGSWYSSINSSNTLLDTFKDLTVSLEDQRNKIRLARQENEDTLDRRRCSKTSKIKFIRLFKNTCNTQMEISII